MYTDQDLDKLRCMLIEKTHLTEATSVACEKISIAIFLSNNDYISKATIKRLFGLAPATAPTSLRVMDMFCRYLGFQDWADFVSNNGMP